MIMPYILQGAHQEYDDLEFVSEEDKAKNKNKAKYMSMISTAHWLVTLGRFNIAIAMSTLSLYRVAPKKDILNE